MMRLPSLSARSEAALPLLRFLRVAAPPAQLAREQPRAAPLLTRLGDLDPTPLPVYEAVLEAYVSAVAPRARAIYQVGRVRGDGLSDLDLIFVPGTSRFDDGAFYSARARLPRARRLFPHDARPLPLDARDAIRFTSHADRRLVYGEDVLAGEPQACGPEQDLALLLEGILKYARFRARALRDGRTPAERLVSKATSLAYSLALFDRLSGDALAAPYAAASLALRARLPGAGAARPQALLDLWHLFASQLAALEAALARRLPIAGEPLAEFARAFLRGQRAVPGLDAERLAARRAAIARYHAALARDGFFLGSLFAKGAYDASAGAARERGAALPQRALGKLVAAAYRLGAPA